MYHALGISSRLALLSAILLIGNGSLLSVAQADYPVIVKVEEDWELEVGEPSVTANAPQVTTCMGPYNSLDGLYFLFTLNFRQHPGYVPGGMQVQQWNGDNIVSANNSPISGQISHVGETVRWTQSLELVDGQVVFQVSNGNSQSWGSFGGQGYLRSAAPCGLTSLLTYNPLVSITESGIGFAGNRVSSLKLMQIRWTTDEGDVYSVSAPIDVDTDLDPWD